MELRPTRRRLLAATVPLTAGLAGCGSLAGESQPRTDATPASGPTATPRPTTSEDRGTVQRADLPPFPSLSVPEPTYRDWVPGVGEQRGAFDAAYNIARLRERREALPADVYEGVSSWAMFGGYVGIEYGELEGMLVGLSSNVVYLGSSARNAVASRLGPTAFERYATREGVGYYRRQGDGAWAYLAVSEGAVVGGDEPVDAEAPAERFRKDADTLFATARGERPRLHEESSVYRRYTDSLGWPLFVAARPPTPVDRMGAASALRPPLADFFADETLAGVRVGVGQSVTDGDLVQRYWLYVPEGAPTTPSELEDAYTVDGIQGLLDDAESLAVRRDGRAVEVATLAPVEEPGGGVDPPLVSLDATLSGDRMTVEHVAGDPLPLARVRVWADGETVDPGDGTLAPGDSLAVEVGEVDRAVVVYELPAGNSTVTLADAERDGEG
jgi:hypothetical protein